MDEYRRLYIHRYIGVIMKTKKVFCYGLFAVILTAIFAMAFTACENTNNTPIKTNPAVTWPEGLTATEGQKLADITLPANTGTAGQFTWTNPADSVGTAGERTHNMTFTPADTAAYNTLTNNVKITVSPNTAGPNTETYTCIDGDGNTYALEITGDSYVLTVTDSGGGSKTSTGKATDDGNGTFTLSPDADPDETFTITVDDDGITDIEGIITFDDESTTEPPEIITPTYAVTVTNGTGGGNYAQGATVTITANTPEAGQQFKNWTTESAGVTFADANSASTTFAMPANAVTVVANFEPSAGPTTYTVTVTGGSGSGDYEEGETVTITANTPEAGELFKNWTTESDGVTFADANSASTTFTMPANAVTVVANFEPITYAIGDTGPGGGKIFYYNADGFTVEGYGEPGDVDYFASYTAHYLEAALVNAAETALMWASEGFQSSGIPGLTWATGSPIGTGRKNTALILSIDADAPAAKACKDFTAGGKSDWFLPSQYEVEEMSKQNDIVEFLPTVNSYWTSTPFVATNNQAWGISMGTGITSVQGKSNTLLVRAIRAF